MKKIYNIGKAFPKGGKMELEKKAGKGCKNGSFDNGKTDERVPECLKAHWISKNLICIFA